MENYLNILHYNFYVGHLKLHLMFNKINPANLIHKLPFLKRRYEKLGIDIQKQIDISFSDKNFGLSITVAGGILWGGMSILFFSILLLLDISISILYIVGCTALSGILSYFYVFKNDKYIQYFDRYEKWSKVEMRKYCWLTLASTFALFILFYLGLIF